MEVDRLTWELMVIISSLDLLKLWYNEAARFTTHPTLHKTKLYQQNVSLSVAEVSNQIVDGTGIFNCNVNI